MVAWPEAHQFAVYDPPRPVRDSPSGEEIRSGIANARLRDGLEVTSPIIEEVIAFAQRPGSSRPGMHTEQEEQDTWGDQARIEATQEVLAGAEDVLFRLEVCWLDGRRAVRVRLTEDLEKYRRRLMAGLGSDRVVIEKARFTARQLAALQAQITADSDGLANLGVYITQYGHGLNSFEIEYFAADFEPAVRVLHERYGAMATIRYQGASRYAITAHPFGSWLAEGHQLHVFYTLGRNGEQPAGCTVCERDDSLIVALTILDWRGAKTLRGGFTPSHATVELKAPVEDRPVIDNSVNRSRPHWTVAAAMELPRPQDL